MEGSSELDTGSGQPSPVKMGRVWSKEARSASRQGWSEGGSDEAWPNFELWDGVRATAGAQGGWQGNLESPQWKVKIIMHYVSNPNYVSGSVLLSPHPHPHARFEAGCICFAVYTIWIFL